MLQYDATIALLSAVALFCGRGAGFAPHVYLSRFCDRLETLDLPAGALSNMRVDCAFRLAEHTGDLRDLDFAEALQAKAAATVVCTTPEQTHRAGKKNDNNNRFKKLPSFSGLRWDDGISEWVAATPATDVRPPNRILRRSRSRCPMESEQGETDADQDTQGGSASETEPERPDPDSPTARGDDDDDDDDDDGSIDSASETDETDNEADTETLSPNTEGSPATRCDSSASQQSSAPQKKRPHPDGSAKPPPQTDSCSSPPVPAGGFLAARARRLSRPMSRAGDELAFDDDQHHHQGGNVKNCSPKKENWLCKKKPTRFRPAIAMNMNMKKRVARASLVYVRPLDESRCLGDGEESEDELSFI
jgi:hypothetical protein